MINGKPVLHEEGNVPDSYVLETSKGKCACDILIAAPGRSGSEWFSNICRSLKLPVLNNRVDLGVRVELLSLIHISSLQRDKHVKANFPA